MNIQREEFLKDLDMVKAGLSPREYIEQSSCFVFQEGEVMTFNDEVACRKEVRVKFSGAVQAASLMDILTKVNDDVLEVFENDKGEIEFKGKRKSFGVVKDKEVFLPIDRVERPKQWAELSPKFTEAIGLVHHCVSGDESRFLLTCVHIHPKFIEACDNLQMMRCDVKTGFNESILVRGTALVPITNLGMSEVAMTKNWLHFQNKDGLMYSCRRYSEEYPDLTSIMNFDGSPITLPKALIDASDRAAVFGADKTGQPLVSVRIMDGVLRIRGEGLTGWYNERKRVNYTGPNLEFVIEPELLKHIADKYSDAVISKKRLKVVGGNWQYITVLGKKEEKTESQAEE